MTTTLGIKAYAPTTTGVRGIVIAADAQLTIFSKGGEPELKETNFNKLFIGDYWVMGFVGTYHPALKRFAARLRDESSQQLVETAVKNLHFPEVQELNRHICRVRGREDMVEFLLATSRPGLDLCFVDVAGNILPKPPTEEEDDMEDYLVLGSGSQYARDFLIEELGSKDLSQATVGLEAAVGLAMEAVSKGKRDIFTGGPPNVAVVTEKGAEPYIQYIRQQTRDLKATITAGIQERLRRRYGEPSSPSS